MRAAKRDMVTAYRLMGGLRAKMAEHVRFQLTTDGFVPYIGAVDRAWGAHAPHFAQLVKLDGALPAGPARYTPAKIVEAIPTVVWGQPDPALISTSFPEGRARAPLRLVQLGADSPEPEEHARDGGGCDGSGVGLEELVA
jgi:hypothetical protein